MMMARQSGRISQKKVTKCWCIAQEERDEAKIRRNGEQISRMARWPVLLGTILTASVMLELQASAQGAGEAEKLLKAMTDYVVGQKTPLRQL